MQVGLTCGQRVQMALKEAFSCPLGVYFNRNGR